MSRAALRTLALVASAGLAVGALSTTSTAADEPPNRIVTLVGSLQDEIGCPADWDPACAESELEWVDGSTYLGQFTIPGGAYEFKVAIGNSWDENYGAGGVSNGPNLPLVTAGPATLEFRYDDSTHLVTVAPADLPGDTVTAADRDLADDSLRTPLTRERFYFVMTDRFANGDPTNDGGGFVGDRLATGLDPTDWGFFHGGDLRGLIDNLDYIEGLGTTAIWLTPSFANKPVQGEGEFASAGYHGYWVTDFTRIDPHLGTNEEMKELVDAAHAREMKVFFDIITNHTADVIDYAEQQYSYVSKAEEPYRDADGNVFDDEDYVNSPDFPELNLESFPYTPVVAPEEMDAKTPDWLDDPTLYHNRGDSTFSGESSTYGDFIGLDDLFTEHPQVQEGMQEIYEAWVDLGIDGFRIDTVKHVNLGFWQEFSPALLEHAASVGNDDFFMFGEVFDSNPAYMSTFTTAGRLPATLDFGFQGAAVSVTNGAATQTLADLFAGDDYYTDSDSNAYSSPTFLGNHDMGRIGYFVDGDLDKSRFAHELMYALRGQPVVYYGDEQGFTGTGGDKAARHDMFASQVAEYNDDPVMGGTPGSADRFETSAPMYESIAALADLRADHAALADGAQITRYASTSAGIFAASRIGREGGGREYLVVANNAAETKTASFDTFTNNGRFTSIYGGGSALRADLQGNVTVEVPPMTVRVFRPNIPTSAESGAPSVTVISPEPGDGVAGRAEIRAAAPDDEFAQASFAYRLVGEDGWQPLGTDDNAPYRVFHDVSDLARGTLVEYRVVVEDSSGRLSARSTFGVVGDPPPAPAGPGVDDVEQPASVSIPGDLNSEMGCGGDWDPACEAAALTLDPADNIWKGTFDLPAGTYSYKVAINGTWDENYGQGGVRNGGNIELTIPAGGESVTFYYDHRTHWVTSSLEHPVVVAVGDFQSEMGCPADWDPACMRAWLQDGDGDGTYNLATVQIPAGNFNVKVALNRSWDENYGAGGVLNGDNLPFAVDVDGSVTTFAWDSGTKVPSVGVAPPPARPDLSVADAYWLDFRTVAYPASRLPAGLGANSLRYRLHWGDGLAVDVMSLSGTSVRLDVAAGAPEGYLALRVPAWAWRGPRSSFPNAAVGVYTDADVLVDATSVQPRS